MKNKYYSLYQKGKEANINIFGDITETPINEGDRSSYSLVKELESLDKSINTINVYINSYGGEVKEGLAIYQALKRHKAKINTYTDSFACSIASVIFMAGDNRYMYESSLLMIHNAWITFIGNAEELRKKADDLDKITELSVSIYLKNINISESELRKLMDEETWITSQEAKEMGFATKVLKDNSDSKACASVKRSVVAAVKDNRGKHKSGNKSNYKKDNDSLDKFIKVISNL